MRKIVGIFAHPDDEAMGPAGTLAKLAREHEVYLLCVTSGEASGKTKAEKLVIGEIRRNELVKSAKILGIKKVFFLGYEDGELKNNIYHTIALDIAEKIEELRPDTLMTFELRGISGHLDHIAVSLITTYVFNQFSFIKKLLYYAISRKESDRMQDYFIYFPDGYIEENVDHIEDISDVWDIKVKAMQAHKSQLHDVNNALKNTSDLPRQEYFLVKEK